MHVENIGNPQAAAGATMRASKQLEAAFLTEMLNIALRESSPQNFGGGAGESQFSSFLNEKYAEAMSQRLDLGLSAAMERADG